MATFTRQASCALFTHGAVLATLCCAGLAQGQAVLMPLQNLPGTNESQASGISADGSFVIGQLNPIRAASAGVMWSAGGGPSDLGTVSGLPQQGISYWPEGVNSDGTVVVGIAGNGVALIEHAFIWRLGQGMCDLNIGQNDSSLVEARGVSGDGEIVVGVDYDRGAFRWTRDSFEILWTGTATAISADGQVIVGTAAGADGNTHAVRWTRESGPVDVGAFSPTAVDRDGTVMVGEITDHDPYGAVRWTAQSGAASLAGNEAAPTAVTSDGKIAVGQYVQGSRDVPCMWIGQSPPIDLDTFLIAHGANLSGWSDSLWANGINGDGTVVCGEGWYQGLESGWIAYLSPRCASADFNHDGDAGTDADIEAFFACVAGSCCPRCDSADFNGDGDWATDADIEAFFRVLAGGNC
jgi:probable HAF family extracellular repeat protein